MSFFNNASLDLRTLLQERHLGVKQGLGVYD